MGQANGRVREVRLGAGGQVEVSLNCPTSAIPSPGQYLLALDPLDVSVTLPTPLFQISHAVQGFWAAPLHPVRWSPGMMLDLVGPLGHGFDLPGNILRLGLVALGDTVARLLPLVGQAAHTRTAITLFTDLDSPSLPSAVEIYPLASLPEALDWPDYLVLDLPVGQLGGLRQVLGLADGAILPCPAQALITVPMPCAGLGQCGACAVQGRRGWKLACEDGPVFDLKDLRW